MPKILCIAAMVIAILVLVLFLTNVRAALIVAAVIPLSLLGTFLGLTLVGGLVLSAGGRVKARNREAATGLCIELDLPVCATC